MRIIPLQEIIGFVVWPRIQQSIGGLQCLHISQNQKRLNEQVKTQGNADHYFSKSKVISLLERYLRVIPLFINTTDMIRLMVIVGRKRSGLWKNNALIVHLNTGRWNIFCEQAHFGGRTFSIFGGSRFMHVVSVRRNIKFIKGKTILHDMIKFYPDG